MNHPVISSLVPVVLLIAAGFAAGKRGWMRPEATRELSNLVFLLLTPALLFRTMSKVRPEQLDFTPVGAYFIGVGVLFAGTLWFGGADRRAAVLALAATFGNTVMIGIPIIGLAYGEPGLVVLLTLYTVHTVVLLTSATLVLELAVAREEAASAPGGGRPLLGSLAAAVRSALLHPVPLPILAGLLFAQTGLALPPLVDTTLQLLGGAFGPMALLLVGLTLAHTRMGRQVKGALALSLVKNLMHPALVALAGWLIGLRGLPLVVMVVTAAMPIGANVFLFSQRYKVGEDLVTAAVAVSTVLALGTLSLVMALAAWL